MISEDFAHSFALDWLEAWNKRDLEAIMNHYSNEVLFSSPFVIKSGLSESGTVRGKNDLKLYFKRALENNPDLHFELHHIVRGVRSIALIYTRNGCLLATEVMTLNEHGEIVEGMSHYSSDRHSV